MVNVSKNIKKLRQARSLTQDGLAEKINVTRQTVSSWENGRTQPDIEMLGALAEAFGVEIEEVIYGEKRKTVFDPAQETVSYKKTVTVIFSVLDTVLTVTGVMLIFVTLWKDLPTLVKGLLAFLPLVIAQASALLLYLKKRDKPAFCETAAVILIAGVAATNALVSTVFPAEPNYGKWLLLDIVLCLPAMWLFDSAAAFTAECVGFIAWQMSPYGDSSVMYAVVIALFASALLFIPLRRKQLGEARYTVCSWAGFATGFFMIYTFCLFVGSEQININPLMTLLAFSLAAFSLGKKESGLAGAFNTLGLVGSALMGICFTVPFCLSMFGGMYDTTDGNEYRLYPWRIVITTALCLIVPIAAMVYNRKGLRREKYRLISSLLIFAALLTALAAVITGSVQAHLQKLNGDIPIYPAFWMLIAALVFALGVVQVLQGAKENRLFPINIGFAIICALAVMVIWIWDLGMLLSGIVLVLLGFALVMVNLRVLNKKKTIKLSQESEAISK